MNPELLARLKERYPGADFSDSSMEAVVYNYLTSIKNIKPPMKINEFSEASNIDELVGDHIRWVFDFNYEIATRVDKSYSNITQVNNSLGAQLDLLESLIGQASETLDGLSFGKADEGTDFAWVTDSFNSNLFTEDSSSVFVNTDQGYVTLLPKSRNVIDDLDVTLDYDLLKAQKALPGVNILTSQVQYLNSGIEIYYDQSPSRTTFNLLDKDPMTWLEIERNFIYPNQKLIQKSKAWVSDSTGNLSSVQEKTQNLDWNVVVKWPTVESEQQIAEFIDPQDNYNSATSTLDHKDRSFNTVVKIILTLKNPRPVSSILITPFLRFQESNLKLQSLSLIVEGLGEELVVASDKFLTKDNNESSSITSSQTKSPTETTSGVRIPFPTDRNVKQVLLTLEGEVVDNLTFAHPFVWVNIHRRSERNYGLFSSVDHEDISKRLPIYEKPPLLSFSTFKTSIIGSLFLSPTTEVPANGSVIDSEVKKGPLDFIKPIASQAARAEDFNKTNAVGSIANLPSSILTGIASSLIGNFLNIGGFSRDFTVTDQQSGFDILTGARSSVALRGIELENIIFSDEGVWTSKEREFLVPVKTFGLYVETRSPEDWPTNEWFEYYVSLNNQNWTPIKPLKGQDIDQSLKLETPIKKFKLQVRLKGNPNDKTRSPELLHYAVKGLIA